MLMWCLTRRKESQNSVLITLMVFQLITIPSLLVEAIVQAVRIKDGETKNQIAAYRETLTDSEEADLLVDFTLEPRNALKCLVKDGKKEGYVFDRDELAEELDEMNNGGAFDDIELDAVAMQSLFSRGGEQEYDGAIDGQLST